MLADNPLHILALYAYISGALAPIAFGVHLLLVRVVLRGVGKAVGNLAQPLARSLLVGAGWAVAGLSASVLPALLMGQFQPSHPGWQPFMQITVGPGLHPLLLLWTIFACQSLGEELLFRAILTALFGILLCWLAHVLFMPLPLLRQPEQSAAVVWRRRAWYICGVCAVLVISVAFALVHGNNPAVTPLAVVNICLAGVVMGLLYWLRGNIAAAWSFHWVWNALMAMIGFPVSGNQVTRPLLGVGVTGTVPGMLSGGQFGPEGSICCTIALTLISAYLAVQAWRDLRARLPKQEAGPTPSASAEADGEAPAADA